MCGQSSSSASSSNQQHNQKQLQNSASEYHKTADMKLDDYFFLDPIFIIAMLVLVVIIVIIVSWWLQKRELAAKEAGKGTDVEKDEQPNARNGEISNKNLIVVDGFLNTIEIEEENEAEALLSDGNGEKIGKHTTFGPSTKLQDGSSINESGENNIDEEGKNNDPDNIVQIIPDRDFRDFPKTEEDMLNMRRKNMIQMLALPPLT